MNSSRLHPLPSRRDVLAAGGALAGCWVASAAPAAAAEVPSTTLAQFLAMDSGSRVSVSRAMVAAADWSAATGGTVVVAGRHAVDAPIVIATHASFRFENARFEIPAALGDTVLTNGARGPVGLHFRNCSDLQLSGTLTIVGPRAPATNRIAGICFDRCKQPHADWTLRLEDLAAGCMVLSTDDGRFGNVMALRMHGRQTFGTGTAGTAVVVAASRRCSFGSIDSVANYKPVLYCSVIKDSAGNCQDNELCIFGAVTGSGVAGSRESSVIAIRSARSCSFKGASGTGFVFGCLIERYDGDEGFSIDDNRIGAIAGEFGSKAVSGEGALVQQTASARVPVGTSYVEKIDAVCSGHFGLAVFAGKVVCGAAKLRGGTRPVYVRDGILRAAEITVSRPGMEGIVVDSGSSLTCDTVNIESGSVDGARTAIRAYRTMQGPSAKVSIGTLRYRHNGAGYALAYLVYDDLQSQAQWSIGTVDGKTAVTDAMLGGRDYKISNRRFVSFRRPAP